MECNSTGIIREIYFKTTIIMFRVLEDPPDLPLPPTSYYMPKYYVKYCKEHSYLQAKVP